MENFELTNWAGDHELNRIRKLSVPLNKTEVIWGSTPDNGIRLSFYACAPKQFQRVRGCIDFLG